MDYFEKEGCWYEDVWETLGYSDRSSDLCKTLIIPWGEGKDFTISVLAQTEHTEMMAIVKKKTGIACPMCLPHLPENTNKWEFRKALELYTEEEAKQLLNSVRSDTNMHFYCEYRYLRHKRNPFFVWMAIEDCLNLAVPYPDFVHDYLFETAKAIIKIPEPSGEKKKLLPEKLAEAMAFKEKDKTCKHFFNQPEKQTRDELVSHALTILLSLNAKKRKNRKTKEQIFKQIIAMFKDKYGILTSSNITKIYRDMAARKTEEDVVAEIYEQDTNKNS